MIRYWIYIIVFLIGIFLTNLLSEGGIQNLLNIYSFIISGVFPFILVCILFGFKETILAFSVLCKKKTEKDVLLNAQNVFKIYGRIIWFTGIAAIIIIIVSMLAHLEDISLLGLNLHIILMTILYNSIIYIGLIIPYTVYINKNLRHQ